MCFRPFWVILILDPHPQNEITPDLAWHKFGPPKTIFVQKIVVQFFFHQISEIFKPKSVSGDSEQMTFIVPKKKLSKSFVQFFSNFKNIKTTMCFRRFGTNDWFFVHKFFCPKYLFHHISKMGEKTISLYLNLSVLATSYLCTYLSLYLWLARCLFLSS